MIRFRITCYGHRYEGLFDSGADAISDALTRFPQAHGACAIRVR